jgi:hypothetical protein
MNFPNAWEGLPKRETASGARVGLVAGVSPLTASVPSIGLANRICLHPSVVTTERTQTGSAWLHRRQLGERTRTIATVGVSCACRRPSSTCSGLDSMRRLCSLVFEAIVSSIPCTACKLRTIDAIDERDLID